MVSMQVADEYLHSPIHPRLSLKKLTLRPLTTVKEHNLRASPN
jgi:hypothetical protein